MSDAGGKRRPAWSTLLMGGMLTVGFVAVAAMAGIEASAADIHPGRAPQSRIVHFSDPGLRVDRATQISVAAPKRVEVGQRVRVSGVVVLRTKAPQPRIVVVQERRSGHWVQAAVTTSTRQGSFAAYATAVTRPTTRYFRAVAPRAAGLSAVTSAVVEVAVGETTPSTTPTPTSSPTPTATPTGTPSTGNWDPAEYPGPNEPAPIGASTDWTFMFPNGGSRWDPCTTIRWAYNPTGAYVGSLDDAKRTFALLSGRTGLHFKYVGSTTYVHYTDGKFPANADIAIGWADAEEVPRLAGNVVGVGGGSVVSADDMDVPYEMTQGFVVLDEETTLRAGFDTTGSPTWGQVMEHEVMHALGLGHASGPEEIMYPAVNSVNHRFGAGDVGGMTRVGASNACF